MMTDGVSHVLFIVAQVSAGDGETQEIIRWALNFSSALRNLALS